MTLRSYLILALALLLLVTGVNLLHQNTFYQNNYKSFPFAAAKKDPFYAFLASVSGFRILVADILWMDAVQYIGDLENAKEQYKQLYPKTRDIITLDPNFTYPYIAVSGILFFSMNEKDKAIELIKYGIEQNPKYWQLNLYLAAYTYAKADNIKMAIHNVESAIKQENHPPLLERILGSMYLKLSEKDRANKKFWTGKAVSLWLDMYEHPSEPENRKYAESHLKEFGLLK